MEKGMVGRSWLPVVLRGAVAGLIAYFLLLALAAYLTLGGRIGEELTGCAVLICAAVAVLVGTTVCTGRKRVDARLPLCCAAVFCTAVLTIGFLTQAELSLRWALYLILAALAGTAPAELRCGRKERKGKRRKRKNVGR